MNKTALHLKDIQFSFDGTPILKKIDFKVDAGSIHGLVGHNGAGKSTLMKIVKGVLVPDKGAINIFDESVQFSSPQDALSAGIAMVYQERSLVGTLSAAQNIFLSGHPHKKGMFLNDQKCITEARELLGCFGADFPPETLVEDLSLGEKQFVEIAKALSCHPRLLILDEPTASLSEAEKTQLFTSLKDLKERGITIIYITHYLEDVRELCDCVSILRDGEMILSRSTDDISIEELVNHMVGDDRPYNMHWKPWNPVRDAKPLLELKNVTTSSVTNISLKVYPGQIVGLAGLLGSGRTEILRAVYGLDPVTEGEVVVDGKGFVFTHPGEAKKQGIALVPEDRRSQGLTEDFSVENNLLMSVYKRICRWIWLSRTRGGDIVDHLIDHLQIKTDTRHQQVRFLSGGNQQKIVVGKCLANDSSLLLLDDPTYGIDIHSKLEIMKIVKAYASRGNGVIFVSSEFKEIASFCDHVYIVKKGRLIHDVKGPGLDEKTLLRLVQ